MELHPPALPRRSLLLSVLFSTASAYFWLVVVYKFTDRRPSKATVYFFLLIFPSCKSLPQTMGRRPPIRSIPRAPPLQRPPHLCLRLLVGCCVSPLNGGHLRPMHHVPLYFLMWPHFAPELGEPAVASPNPTQRVCPGPIGSGGTKSRGCGGCCHGDRGQCSWRVGRRRLILMLCVVVVGCVLCVVGSRALVP